MNTFVRIRKDSYHDSVFLLRLSQAAKGLAGVDDAVVAMGTPQNRELLLASGYSAGELEKAGPNDLVIAVRGSAAPEAIEAGIEQLLQAKKPETAGPAAASATSLSAAIEADPGANLVLVSVPGEWAAREAHRALGLGRHVLLFSDNVSVEEELALKREAVERGLMMMGPDCGTAIVNGVPLAFANAVRRGTIGVVGAAGTGIQEITSLLHRLGGGVSQAIGTGGRDLSEKVGGIMTLFGIEALAADPATSVLIVVSKPPAAEVAKRVLEALASTPKPTVVHFVGAAPRPDEPERSLYFADSLAEAAEKAARLAGIDVGEGAPPLPSTRIDELAWQLGFSPRLVGLFCGGTTGAEALSLLGRGGIRVRSNLAKGEELHIAGDERVSGHVLLDLGDDLFTRGRPHPMIEPLLRNERLLVESSTEEGMLLLFDCVLGYGAHADPAGVLAEGIAAANGRCRSLVAVGSVTGTDDDPQGFGRSKRTLESAGAIVLPDNRRAAEAAVSILRRGRS